MIAPGLASRAECGLRSNGTNEARRRSLHARTTTLPSDPTAPQRVLRKVEFTATNPDRLVRNSCSTQRTRRDALHRKGFDLGINLKIAGISVNVGWMTEHHTCHLSKRAEEDMAKVVVKPNHMTYNGMR